MVVSFASAALPTPPLPRPNHHHSCPPIYIYMQDALVRTTAVDALLRMYGRPENVSPLHDFTARFSSRFGELLYDVDEGVAVKGVS